MKPVLAFYSLIPARRGCSGRTARLETLPAGPVLEFVRGTADAVRVAARAPRERPYKPLTVPSRSPHFETFYRVLYYSYHQDVVEHAGYWPEALELLGDKLLLPEDPLVAVVATFRGLKLLSKYGQAAQFARKCWARAVLPA